MAIFNEPAERIMVALDVDEFSQAQAIVKELEGIPVTFKVGNQLGTYEGWRVMIETIHESGAKIFCDTKFKDIPVTVEGSARSITRHQPDFFNVMADNSLSALRGAITGVDDAMGKYGLGVKPIVLGVTVLTSMSDEESMSIYGASSAEKVQQFAEMAGVSGLDGVVCSSEEATMLKSNKATEDLLIVTPGIRPIWAVTGDQTRILSPKQAVEAGSDYLVIGRPITQPPTEIGSPRNAVEKIIEELS